MPNHKLVLTYDGHDFVGWQIQNAGISIQGKVQESLKIVCREPVKVIGAGRTDAGVHAVEQTASFRTSRPLNIDSALRSLNGILPYSIRALSLEVAEDDFHPIFSAKRKIYHYHLCLGREQSPFLRGRSWLVRDTMDISSMETAAKGFVGTHDFSSFANKAREGSAGKNPIRTIYRADVIRTETGLRLEFESNGFLYKMVRNLVGFLVDVGRGKFYPSDVEHILSAKDRRLSSAAAPARGLFLVKTIY